MTEFFANWRWAIGAGYELVRRPAGAVGQLKPQIPWLRVFVEGVVSVGGSAVGATWRGPSNKRLLLSR